MHSEIVGPFRIESPDADAFSVVMDVDDLWRIMLATLPDALKPGDRGIRDATLHTFIKNGVGYAARSWNNRLVGDYPQAPIKVGKGEDFILENLRYFVQVASDLLFGHGGVTLTLTQTSTPGQYHIRDVRWGDDDLERPTDSGESRTLPADAAAAATPETVP